MKSIKELSTNKIVIVICILIVVIIVAVVIMSGKKGNNPNEVVRINSINELLLLQNPEYWNSSFVLNKDIDMSQIDNWTPVGTSSNKFSGTFDGNGHKLINFKIDSRNVRGIGFFGYVSSKGEIKNLTLVNVSVYGGFSSAGLASVFAGKASNIKISGNVYGQGYDSIGGVFGTFTGSCDNIISKVSVTGHSVVGGLIGDVQSGTIKNSFVGPGVMISSDGNKVGGLVGVAQRAGIILIDNCYSKANISADEICGGLIGRAYTSSTVDEDSITLTNSYYVGDITRCSNKAGGIVGELDSASIGRIVINNCYCASYIDQNCTSNRGGVIGYMTENSSIITNNSLLWVNMYTDGSEYHGVGNQEINFTILPYDFEQGNFSALDNGRFNYTQSSSPKNRVLLSNEPIQSEWDVFNL